MVSEKASFILTNEEIFYCLRLAQLPNLLGLGADPFGDTDEDTLEKIMEVVFRVLIARQMLIAETNKGFRLDKAISAALTVCARPEKMVMLMVGEEQQENSTTYYCSSSDLDVKQEVLFHGMHQFQIGTDIDLGKRAVLNQLKEVPSNKKADRSSTNTTYNIQSSTFERARETASDSIEDSKASLIKQGVDAKQAANLAHIFAKPELRMTLQFLHRPSGAKTIKHNILSIIYANNLWWLIKADSPTSETLALKSATKYSVIKTIEETYLALGV